jgi:fibronectin-binding autotransporter adhesin
MRLIRVLRFLGIIAVLGPSWTLLGRAQGGTLYFSSSANSVWDDGVTADWSEASGGPYDSVWRDGSDANFQGTAGSVNVTGLIDAVNSLTFSVDGYTLNGGAINLTGTGGNVTTGAGSDVIGSVLTGALGLTKLGPGTLILIGSETNTGPTNISGGTLQLGDGTPGHDASLATGGMINNASLVYNVFSNQVASYAISGSGGLIKSGPGTLMISGVNTFGGGDANGDVFGIVSLHQGNLLVSPSGVLTNNTSEISVGDTPGLTATLSMSGGLAMTPWGTASKSGVNVGMNGGSGVVTLNGNSLLDASCTANSSGGTGGSFSNVVAIGLANSSGTVTVGGTSTLRADHGSPVSNGSIISVGEGGAGVLIVQDQGQVQAANFNLGGTFYGTSGGAGSLYLNGGTVSVPAVQNDSGATGNVWFNGGTLQATAGSANFISAGGTLNAYVQSGGAVIDSNGNNITINQPLQHDITGQAADGGLTKVGAGMLTLTGVSTYSGPTTISGGTLQLGTGQSGQDGSINATSGVTDNAALVYNLAGSQTATYPIGGGGSLTTAGPGMLVLSGVNTYSGDTNVLQGTLQLANSNAGQNSTINVGLDGGLVFAAGVSTVIVGSIGGGGNMFLGNAGGGAITLVTGGNNASTTYSGVISGPGTLVHGGSGTLVLSGSNTYSGGTILTQDAGPNECVTNDAGFGTGPITWAGDNTVCYLGNLTFSNTVNLASNATATQSTMGNNVTFSGPISGPGNLNKIDLGTLVLSGSNNYSGGTTIGQGALQLANSAAVQASTVSVNVDNGLQFNSGIGAFIVGGLAGIGALTLSDTGGGPVTLEVGGDNANTTYSGPIGGNGGLVKAGMMMLDLEGSNTFTGGMVLDPGVVTIGSDAALGSSTGSATWGSLKGNVIFADSSTLQAGASIALSASRTIVIGPGATATFDTQSYALTINGPISGSGGLREIGSGTLVLAGSDSYTGGTNVACGTLEAMSSDSLPEGGRLIVGQGASAIFAPAGPGAGIVAVPEPGTLALLAAAVLSGAAGAVHLRRYRRARRPPYAFGP